MYYIMPVAATQYNIDHDNLPTAGFLTAYAMASCVDFLLLCFRSLHA